MSYKWESFMMCWNSCKRPGIHFSEWFLLHYLHVVRFAFWFCRKKKQLISINSFYMQHWTLYKIWRGPLMLRMLILKFPFVLQNSLILLIFYPCSCISIAFILTVLFSWLFVRFLKSVDRFNDLIVSVYVTAGHILSSVV